MLRSETPLHFDSIEGLKETLSLLKRKGLIHIQDIPRFGIKRVTVARNIANHLEVAPDGTTYLKNKGDAIRPRNIPLARALNGLIYSEDSYKIHIPAKSHRLFPFIPIFPMITENEKTEELFRMEDFDRYVRLHSQAPDHPSIMRNLALETLIVGSIKSQNELNDYKLGLFALQNAELPFNNAYARLRNAYPELRNNSLTPLEFNIFLRQQIQLMEKDEESIQYHRIVVSEDDLNYAIILYEVAIMMVSIVSTINLTSRFSMLMFACDILATAMFACIGYLYFSGKFSDAINNTFDHIPTSSKAKNIRAMSLGSLAWMADYMNADLDSLFVAREGMHYAVAVRVNIFCLHALVPLASMALAILLYTFINGTHKHDDFSLLSETCIYFAFALPTYNEIRYQINKYKAEAAHQRALAVLPDLRFIKSEAINLRRYERQVMLEARSQEIERNMSLPPECDSLPTRISNSLFSLFTQARSYCTHRQAAPSVNRLQ